MNAGSPPKQSLRPHRFAWSGVSLLAIMPLLALIVSRELRLNSLWSTLSLRSVGEFERCASVRCPETELAGTDGRDSLLSFLCDVAELRMAVEQVVLVQAHKCYA